VTSDIRHLAAQRGGRHDSALIERWATAYQRVHVDGEGAGDELVKALMEGMTVAVRAYLEAAADASALAAAIFGESPWDRANHSRSDAARWKRLRAVAYTAQGLSAAVVGQKLAREDGRAEAYKVRQVREWLAIERGAATGKHRVRRPKTAP